MKQFSEILKKAQLDNFYWESRIRHSFAQQLILASRKQGLKRSEFANRAGVSQAYLSRVLAGNENLSIRTMVKLARALNLDVKVNAFHGRPIFHTQDRHDNVDWEAMSQALLKQHGSPRVRMFKPGEPINQEHEYHVDFIVESDEQITVAA